MRLQLGILGLGLAAWSAFVCAQDELGSASASASAASVIKLATDINESVSEITVTVKGMNKNDITGKVVITQFKPQGDGPFPILILNHGRSATKRMVPERFRYTANARYFVKRGFAVFVPTRIGYGALGDDPDPEYSGACSRKNYAPSAEASSTEQIAVIDYVKTLNFVDPQRILLVGQSVGGYSTVATAAKNPPGVIAAINFAGGDGGDPDKHPGEPCQGKKLEDMYATFGATTKLPVLWIYTENDQFFNPQNSLAWFAAYAKAGAENAQYKLMPAFGKDGHSLFSAGIKLWEPVVSNFLELNGFPKPKNN